MRSNHSQGWILLETILALACVALVLSGYLHQQGGLDARLADLKHNHRMYMQEKMSAQIENVFAQSVSIQASHTSVPKCVACRSAALKSLLDYELNQW